jgi:23S rRNA pseudouridine1911/1915/1917 synthase
MRKPFEIIFKDEYIIVLNKIAKLLVHPSPKKEKYTLTSLLEKEIGKKAYPCHRLDRETTGLIIYAKTKKVQKAISMQFKKLNIKKGYIAFIKGKLNKEKGGLEGYVLHKEGERYGQKPKKARTFYKVLNRFDGFSIVKLEPLSGRTNQLRIQLARIGHPILGERKYAFGREFKHKFRRVALHAFYISFIHPISKERVELKIDLPEDMKKFLQHFKEGIRGLKD